MGTRTYTSTVALLFRDFFDLGEGLIDGFDGFHGDVEDSVDDNKCYDHDCGVHREL